MLVFDGAKLIVPEVMGSPKEGQLLGTIGERLTEVAGRICYDSLGQGRSSLEYHKHINDVNHGSVQEHYNFTVFISCSGYVRDQEIVAEMLNRPGCWTIKTPNGVRITANMRAIREWENTMLGRTMKFHGWQLCPNIVEKPIGEKYVSEVVEPDHDEEKWVSLYMRGSRGFSHEQVRHKWRTAVSQRSTRYVDESEGDWIQHPLLVEFLRERGSNIIDPSIDTESYYDVLDNVEMDAKSAYDHVVQAMQSWLIGRGESKITARKQARGAARGYLGNALATEMIFSASIAQWKRMIAQRSGSAADAEIRELYLEGVIPALKESRYGATFE